MMKVKICGITNIEDALLCAELGADMLGFIFYAKSKRYISFNQVKEIINKLPPAIDKVGVFVDYDLDKLNSYANEIGLTSVQLHGSETQEFINKVKLPVIKALRIKKDFDFSTLEQFRNCTLLLDTYSEKELGGTGETFDWNIIPVNLRSQIILAGGISSDNIEYIYRNIKPEVVDLSSSVESLPGKKDHAKLEMFFNKINQLRKEN